MIRIDEKISNAKEEALVLTAVDSCEILYINGRVMANAIMTMGTDAVATNVNGTLLMKETT
jgi:hypothetical protein